jgi:RNA polymerase sigma-70 factor (ECF subfamily)
MPSETIELLTSIRAGDRGAVDRLFELVYDDLRRIAGKYTHQVTADKSLQPTEVVHEAFLKLVNQKQVDWRDKSHFLAVGAKAMRHILVDDAKRRGRQKRGSNRRQVPLDDSVMVSPSHEDIVAIDEALQKLTLINETRAKIVEMRFFAGMTMDEVAEALGVSKRSAEGHWTFAKAWLRREMSDGNDDSIET